MFHNKKEIDCIVFTAQAKVNVHLGRRRSLAHSLQPLEPVQGPIDLTAQARLAAQWAIGRLSAWNDHNASN